ncbi:MAG: hypothetical protein CR997_01665 [Acidobacteria bacterium]|nr:MAG: hypothetical protein CR997_01665 [Acidobacteriota bacterium]
MGQLKKYMGEDGNFRAFVVETGNVGRELYSRLQPYPIALRIITEAVTSGLLMASDLKVQGTISIKASGSGPLKHVTIEANSQGEARGYCGDAHLQMEKKAGEALFFRAIGEGELTVRKRLVKSDKIYSSVVPLIPGGWAENLTNYYQKSEQISSGMKLGVELDPESGIKGAGGILIMAMPGADPEVLNQLESNVGSIPPLGEIFSREDGQDVVRDTLFKGLAVKHLETKNVLYRCNCSASRVLAMLNSLGEKEIEDMKQKSEPLVVNCVFCSRSFKFQPEELT